MSKPKKHHYLPEWYLARWTTEGLLFEYKRLDHNGDLFSCPYAPGGTGYEENLYRNPMLPSEEAVSLETDFLQKIDDSGARALHLLEKEEMPSLKDSRGLVQFVLSLMIRTPERITFLETSIASGFFKDQPHERLDENEARGAALFVFGDLMESPLFINRISEFRAFLITLKEDAYDLLTSDSPIVMSDGINHQEGCCQSNCNLSPIDAGIPNSTIGHAIRFCHSARAAEREAL